MSARVLLLDNRDSFTWNVADALARAGGDVAVVRSDEATADELLVRAWDAIVVSPGPGGPGSAGCSLDVVRRAMSRGIPLFGICLGMQCIAESLGAKIVRAPAPVHGSATLVEHDGAGVLRDMPRPFAAGRYHSLAVQEATLPSALQVTARSADGVVMALRHRTLPAEGVQFHPESVLTPEGLRCFDAFLQLAAATPSTHDTRTSA